MKRGFGELVYNRIRSFINKIFKPDKNRDKVIYRGASCDTSDIKIRKQGNNRMSYRGISYQLLNSEIKIKK
jgi:hypothetical protein